MKHNVFRKFVALLLASLFALSCVSVVAAAEISEAVKGVSPGYLSSSSGLAGNATGITISMPSGSANYGYLFEDNPSGVYDYSFVIEMPTSTDGVFAGKEPGSDVFSDIYGLHFGIPGALEVTLNPRSVVEGYFGVKVEGSSYTPNYTTYIDVEGIGKSFAPASGATFEVSGEIDLGGKTVSIYFDGMLYAQNLPIPKDGPIDMFTFFTPDSLEYDIVVQDFQVSRIGDSQDSNVPEAVKGVSPGYLGSSSGLSGSASDVTISMPSGSANYGYLFEDNPSGVYDYSFVIEMPT
ncbi:MAG: hypothetical protein LBT59_10710, partial [Clostridiales bacterium]|nr:hypothetical protein [Clostridiales bacterium]